jgi:hypothetical protein
MVFMLEEENAMFTGDSKCPFYMTSPSLPPIKHDIQISETYLTQIHRRPRPRYSRLRRPQNLPRQSTPDARPRFLRPGIPGTRGCD